MTHSLYPLLVLELLNNNANDPQKHRRELCFGNFKRKNVASSLLTSRAEATAACPAAHSQEYAPHLLPARAPRTSTRKPEYGLHRNRTFCAALHLFCHVLIFTVYF